MNFYNIQTQINATFPFLQIIFDSFTVGRFDEGMVDSDIEGYESNVNPVGELPGCPEGFMQASFELIAFWKIF